MRFLRLVTAGATRHPIITLSIPYDDQNVKYEKLLRFTFRSCENWQIWVTGSPQSGEPFDLITVFWFQFGGQVLRRVVVP